MDDSRRCKAVRQGVRCKKAAIRGGFVCATHGGAAPRVKRAAAQRLADLIDPDRALREAARLAYSDIRELFDMQGNLRPITDWPPELAAAVGSVDLVKRNVAAGDGQTDSVLKVKLWDKPRNLELLFRHLGLLEDRMKVQVESGPVIERILGRLKRADDGKS